MAFLSKFLKQLKNKLDFRGALVPRIKVIKLKLLSNHLQSFLEQLIHVNAHFCLNILGVPVILSEPVVVIA